MEPLLVIGAGITGGYIAAGLCESGADVSLLARGQRADRLEAEGLRLRDGLTGGERTVAIPIVREPPNGKFPLVLVCVQDSHRPSLEPVLKSLPGRPIVWFLGNTTRGYEPFGRLLGRERVVGGFPDVGGTWDGDVLVYADRKDPGDRPFNRLVAGEAFPEARPALELVCETMQAWNRRVVRYSPIMAWHLCHAALILPLAAVHYRHEGNLQAAASDSVMLTKSIRAVAQGLQIVRRQGYPILPRSLHALRFFPPALAARKVSQTIKSPFGAIALAGHANTAREEMHQLAQDMLSLAGKSGGEDFRELLREI